MYTRILEFSSGWDAKIQNFGLFKMKWGSVVVFYT